MISFDETIAKSRELDRFLTGKDRTMPEIGGSKLSLSLGSTISEIRTMMKGVNDDIIAAAQELRTEIEKGRHVADAIRAEAKTVRDSMDGFLGNAIGGENTRPDGEMEP